MLEEIWTRYMELISDCVKKNNLFFPKNGFFIQKYFEDLPSLFFSYWDKKVVLRDGILERLFSFNCLLLI